MACGYRVFTWPLGSDGGPAAADNALGRDLPVGPLAGGWTTENMHTVVRVDGEERNCVVLPDPDATVVNPGGGHSVRGGALARKLYRHDGPTSDRLTTPLLRVDGTLVPVPWDLALDLVADLSRHVVDLHGPLAWGMKIYSYEFFENTYAASKLALASIRTPNWSPHHAPAEGDDVPGLSDAGIDAFGACFADDRAAEVILIAGSDPYETKSVRFTQWQSAGGARLVVVDPRRTFTAAWAEANGGLHLQVEPGTDAFLYSAIVRDVLEHGWEDHAFVRDHTATRALLDTEPKWRRARFGRTRAELLDELRSDPDLSLTGAARITGVPSEKIREAALLLSGGTGPQPRTSVLFEKGVYWTHNYENTAAIANLGLVLGATGREGRATARMGGHQRGGVKAAGYPHDLSPHSVDGHPVEMDTERWLVEGNTRLRWVVGTNWLGATAGTSALRARVAELVGTGDPVTVADLDHARQRLVERIDAGGMVLVHQETYPNDSTRYADVVLPAATWGEEDFTRANAERRVRLYQRFMDPPGAARPDWWIFAEVGRRMGYDGFDWPDANAVATEALPRTAGSRKDCAVLVDVAEASGRRVHEVLADVGTTGFQAPLGLDGGTITETPRLHADLRFKTDSGRANFVHVDLDAVRTRNRVLAPRHDRGEVWVLNGRVNALWNNLSDYVRRPLAMERWPANLLEVNPLDARRWGLDAGDLVAVENAEVLDHVGATISGGFTAVVYPTDVVPPGVTFTYFLYPGSDANDVVAADTSLQPLNLRYPFKLGRGTVRRLGRAPGIEGMSFAPRNLVPSTDTGAHDHDH